MVCGGGGWGRGVVWWYTHCVCVCTHTSLTALYFTCYLLLTYVLTTYYVPLIGAIGGVEGEAHVEQEGQGDAHLE